MNFITTIGCYTLGIGLGQQSLPVIILGAVWAIAGTLYELHHNLEEED